MGRGFAGPQGAGIGWESFLCHAGWGRAGMRQDKIIRGRDEDPILRPHLALLSSLRGSVWNEERNKNERYMPMGKIDVGRKACQSFFCIYSRLVQPNLSLPSQPLRSIFSCCILLTMYSTHELIRSNWLCLSKIGWLGLIFFFFLLLIILVVGIFF